MTLGQAGVSLVDCDHRTPPAAEHGYPYIAIPQLKGGHVDLTGVRRISASDYLEWTKKLKPRPHDVIVVRRCNSGDSALIPPGLECAIGQNLVVLRSDGRVVEPRFLRWLVRGPDWWDQVSKYINVGAVFDSLRCRDIPNFELPVPPRADQVAIAEVLDALDSRISLLRETNATLEAIAQALFKSWFIDFDPVRAKSQGLAPAGMDEATAALFPDSFEESVLGLMPKRWRIEPVSAVCEAIFSGGTPDTRRTEYWNGNLLWFSSGETREPVVVDTEKRINALAVRNSSTRLSKPGDVLIASAGQGLTRGQTSYCAVETYINQSVVAVRTDPAKGHAAWTFHNLSRRYDEMRSLSDSHSIRGSLTTKILASMKLICPPVALMNSFGAVVGPMLASQAENTRKSATLATLRDTLLPRLISGQLRLPETEALAACAAPAGA